MSRAFLCECEASPETGKAKTLRRQSVLACKNIQLNQASGYCNFTYRCEERVIRELGEKATIATRLWSCLRGISFSKKHISRRRWRLRLNYSIWVHASNLCISRLKATKLIIIYICRNLSRADLVFSGLAYICQDSAIIKPYFCMGALHMYIALVDK